MTEIPALNEPPKPPTPPKPTQARDGTMRGMTERTVTPGTDFARNKEGARLLTPETRVGGQRGGSRPGRTLAERSARARRGELIDGILNDGDVLPLEVLVDNTRYWHRKALAATRKLEAMEAAVSLPEHRKVLEREIKEYREYSTACAERAAPFLHPKVAPVTVDGTNADLNINIIRLSREDVAPTIDVTPNDGRLLTSGPAE